MSTTKEIDLEAGTPPRSASPIEKGTAEAIIINTPEEEIARTRELQQKKGVLRFLRRGEEWLDAKMGIELQGVDRIPEEAKRPPSIWNAFWMWFSFTCHVGTIPIGMLGPGYGLSLGQSVAMIIMGTGCGAACTGALGTLGPKVWLQSYRQL